MTSLAIHSETNAITLPPPRGGPITIRPASMQGADVMFIDALQKKHNKMVGFMPMSQIVKRIKGEQNGKVLIAQDPATTERVGYVIFADKYFKREDLGIVYQLNITPHKQRGLVGASLVKAAFEACPWGVKLFCCWCAQDLDACHFWESIGFVPIAFRAGSRGKEHGGKRAGGSRMQILWQRRIRRGANGEPDEATPYWYPTETSGGAMKENRIVLPIPPGKHWSDELPCVLPGGDQKSAPHIRDQKSDAGGGRALTSDLCPLTSERKRGARKPKASPAPPPARPKRGLWFTPPHASHAPRAPTPPTAAAQSSSPSAAPEDVEANTPKPKRQKQRNDPKHIAFARELRDRYLDEVNSGRLLLSGDGKYDVSRQLAADAVAPMLEPPPAVHLLNAA